MTVRTIGGSGTGAGGNLPVLRLTSPVGAATMDSGPIAATPNRFLLSGPLPAGRPDPAAVYRFGADQAPAATVTKLARALGLKGIPQRTAFGWQLAADRRVLMVDDGGSWAWRLSQGGVTAHSPVQCVRAPCPNEPTNSGRVRIGLPAPPASVAERIAADALRALGLPTDELTTTINGQLAEVRAPRRVDGRDAAGFGTSLSVSGDRKITDGYGTLGRPQRGPAYPLVTAAEAFRRLQAQPYAEILLCRMTPTGGCAATPPVTVTGARIGLVLATDSPGAVLVPAWLFTVSGQLDPTPVVAVDSRYLGTPPLPPSSGTGGEPNTGGGSMPKSEAPASSGTAAPPDAPSVPHNPATPPPG